MDKEIEKFVKDWMEGHEPDTFIKDQYDRYMYTSGATSLNLEIYFQDILKDYLEKDN